MIKLCFKEYDYKINSAACKMYFDQTGEDLTYTLMRFIQAFQKSMEMGMIDRMVVLFGVIDKFKAATLIHCIVKQKESGVSFDEINDAVHRVSYLPGDQVSDLCRPWCLVLSDVALDTTSYFAANLHKKKADTSDRSE